MKYRNEIYKLKELCYSCNKCGLGSKKVNGKDPHVFGTGRVPAEIIVVAEAPGEAEVIEKKPLVGRAGRFYDDKIIKVAEIDRKDIFTFNSVLCRPNEKNRTPTPYEITTCREHLDAQILLHNPKLLVPMGNAPLFSVLDTTGITKYRGKLCLSREWSDGKRIPIFPIFHPAYCLRGSGLKEMEQDALELGRLYRKVKAGNNLEV